MHPSKPSAPGSTAPVGPTGGAARVYPPMSGKTPVSGPTSKSDPWRPGPLQAVPNGSVPTKGAVPVAEAKELPGNQGANNSHTKPGKIKPVGTPKEMRRIGSVISTSALQKVGGGKLGVKNGASNAARTIYPKLASQA